MGDVLRAGGIYRQGYGTVSKVVMLDSRLSIGAKGLYTYLCSFANAEDIAFPFRSKIIRDLDLSINTLYKYMNELISVGYITKEQQRNGTKFSYNLYTIVQAISLQSYEAGIGHAKVRQMIPNEMPYVDIDILGYGKIPKLVTTDNRISIKAKGIFGFIASNNHWLNTDLCSWNNISTIMRVSKTTYYKSINELLERGYIVVFKEAAKKGFDKPIYQVNTIYEYKKSI